MGQSLALVGLIAEVSRLTVQALPTRTFCVRPNRCDLNQFRTVPDVPQLRSSLPECHNQSYKMLDALRSSGARRPPSPASSAKSVALLTCSRQCCFGVTYGRHFDMSHEVDSVTDAELTDRLSLSS